ALAPARGVTGGSFGWIGDSGRDWPGGGEDLRQYVRADYQILETELPDVHLPGAHRRTARRHRARHRTSAPPTGPLPAELETRTGRDDARAASVLRQKFVRYIGRGSRGSLRRSWVHTNGLGVALVEGQRGS